MNLLKKIKIIFIEKGLAVDIPVSIAIFWIINMKQLFISQVFRDDLKDITNSLISTFVSISGFSLAALTIIITIRANIIGKADLKPRNAMETLFSSAHYFLVTDIFKQIIIIQSASALILYISWIVCRLDTLHHFSFIVISCYTLLTSVLRLFFILFKILGLEKIKKKDPYIAQKDY